jgi:hypothetical protein
MNTNPVENKTFLNKARNFIFGNKKVNGVNASASTSANGNKTFMNKAKNYMFGNKKANSANGANGANGANAIASPESSGTSGVRIVIFVFLFLLIGFIVSYLTVMTIKYLTTDCMNKKSYGDYIFGFNYNAVCRIPFQPVVVPEKCEGQVAMEEESMDGNRLLSAGAIANVQETQNSTDMTSAVSNIHHSNPTNPVVDVNKGDLEGPEQVFHISNQNYTYDEASCKCGSYDAKLATYPQIVEAYNKGADWCSYGWSQGQTAYYPTQKCNWEKKSKKEREECGNPGINGGFFSDKKLRFGVNCFGKKPEGKIIKIKDDKCGSEDGDNGKCSYNSRNRLETDEIAPFNDNTWSA